MTVSLRTARAGATGEAPRRTGRTARLKDELSNVTELSPRRKEPWPSLARHREPVVLLAHASLIAGALFAAFLLAYDFRFQHQRGDLIQRWVPQLFLPMAALAIPVKLFVFYGTGQLQGSWRYVGLRDLFGVISASLVGTFGFLTVYFLLENAWYAAYGHLLIDGAPIRYLRQSVFALDLAMTVAFVAGARILVRFYYEEVQPRRLGEARRALILGAGDAGEAVLRELFRVRGERYECVGILDDDAHLFARIHGVEIIGRSGQLRELCERLGVREVFIAMPGAGPRKIREIVEQCHGLGVRFRTVPAVTDLIEGRVQVNQIRQVDIADLLGREPVELDTERIAEQLRDRRVLVSGAGGSIGSEMCRQIASFRPRRLVLVEQAENGLFEIDRELRASYPRIDVVPYVADITDKMRMRTLFAHEQPSSVFHAAAHKHVPMMELNVGEAIKNNIGGTAVVAQACLASGVEKMVLISTDKAVNPTSIMGCTKRVAELYVQSLGESGVTQFVTVRFGNVLGSSGSVVPIFREQIARGGPVTVTHPEMKRYFMTIPEAAQLVLQAGMMGKGGEIYVLHMGEPMKIVELARDMITLSGLRPGTDIDIVFTGIRPGEKLFEELASESEDVGDTAHPKIGIWKHRPGDPAALQEGVRQLLAMPDHASADELRAALSILVPECTWSAEREVTIAGAAPVVRT